MNRCISLLLLIFVFLCIAGAQIPIDSLVGYFPMNGNANDESGYGNHGTVSGATLVADRFGGSNSAYSFNGINNCIDIGDVDVLNPHYSDMTVVTWVKTTSSAHSRFYSKGTHGGSQPGYTLMEYPGTNKATLILGAGGREHAITADNVVNDGVWHCVVGLINRNGEIELWFDGVKQTGNVIIHSKYIGDHATEDIGAGTLSAGIGASPSRYGQPSYCEFFNGSIDDVRIYKRVLSPAEINSLYHEGGWDQYRIIATAGENGSITPIDTIMVDPGSDTTFTFTPNPCYLVDSVLVDGVPIDSLSSYTFRNISTDHTIRVVYAIQEVIINASTGGNGIITPSDSVTIHCGTDQRFTFTPNTGYHVDSIFVDEVYVDSIVGYTFMNVTSYHTLHVKFAINTYTLHVTTENGTVTKEPDKVMYDSGMVVMLTAYPDSCYHFVRWSGDTSSFDNPLNISMSSEQSITANFELNQDSITALSGPHGTISPSGLVVIDCGTSQQFTFSPSVNYCVDSIFVDGTWVDSTDSYTFNEVFSNHTIRVTFRPLPGKISGRVFDDQSGDGINDTLDLGVTSRRVLLSGEINETTYTNTHGEYSFLGLREGSYIVSVEVDSGWVRTTPGTGQYTISLGPGESSIGNDLGFFKLVSVSGTLFHDVNMNGMFDNPNKDFYIQRYLRSAHDNCLCRILILEPDSGYEAYYFSLGPIAQYEGIHLGIHGWLGSCHSYDCSNSLNFGHTQVNVITTSQNEFIESPLPNKMIYLYINDTLVSPIDSVISNFSYGTFSFSSLGPGNYFLRVRQDSGWFQTSQIIPAITLSSGTNVEDMEVGVFRYGSISGKKFLDLNGDGLVGASDSGLSGWNIYLEKDGAEYAMRTTALDGSYSFDSLLYGVYSLREDQRAGWIQTIYPTKNDTVVSGKTFINRNFGSIFGISLDILAEWNMVSLPVGVPDNRKSILFPHALSSAFAFEGGYQSKSNLLNGSGYWLKFDSAQTVNLIGANIVEDTIAVRTGWNMIGSISDTISVDCIVPVGTSIQSSYFGYLNGYVSSDMILPGKAYWVKVSTDGVLILKGCIR